MDSSVIKYGIGFTYLPDWGVKEALREIYQNFKDFGEYVETSGNADGLIKDVNISNTFRPESLDFLQIGNSGKRGDDSTIGGHGEGLKMAMMVLLRCGFTTIVYTKHFVLKATTYNEPNVGECFGVKAMNNSSETRNGRFVVTFQCPKQDYDEFHKVGCLQESDYIFKDSFYGSVVSKNPGDIYVGGLFVCNLKGYRHAFDFPPKRISLDRDRKVPSSWDVKYYSNEIMSAWKEGIKKTSDLMSEECSRIGFIPHNVAEKFKPTLTKEGEVVLTAGKIVANHDQSMALMRNPLIAKRVVKLKSMFTRKKKPHTLMKEYYDKYKGNLSANAKTDLMVLVQKSKDW